jgi:hypothetical protein
VARGVASVAQAATASRTKREVMGSSEEWEVSHQPSWNNAQLVRRRRGVPAPGIPLPEAHSFAQHRGCDESPVGGASRRAEAARRLRRWLAQAGAPGRWNDGVARKSDSQSLCERGTMPEANGGELSMPGVAPHNGRSWLENRDIVIQKTGTAICGAVAVRSRRGVVLHRADRGARASAPGICFLDSAPENPDGVCWRRACHVSPPASVICASVLLHNEAAVDRRVRAPPSAASRGDSRQGWRTCRHRSVSDRAESLRCQRASLSPREIRSAADPIPPLAGPMRQLPPGREVSGR